jgi:hypothetical protein
VRVSLRWLGVRKTLTPQQQGEAAESFGAQRDFLSARKKLLDTRHPAFKEVTAVRGQVISHWKANTLPFPEPGVRLIQQSRVELFHQQMLDFRRQLQTAVAQLESHYGELQSAARRRLGRLFNPNDYPPSLEGLFEIDWDFPAVEPPDYLLQLNPALYEQERIRVSARFEEAVRLAEQAFVTEFGRLVTHLTERLTADPGGDKKVFRDSAVNNLVEFFERFRQLDVGSNQELDDLVNRAQQVIHGVQTQELRDNSTLRQQIASQLNQVEQVLDGMIGDRPRRRIVRGIPSTNGAAHAIAH